MRLACWRARLGIANFSGRAELDATFQLFREDCFGAMPKLACETHALPERHDLNAARVTN